jgi:hypothetical protein
MTTPGSITIRRATPRDASAVERLAELDSARPPAGDLLVAEVDGELWAAVGLGSGTVVADPFRPSGEVAELVHLRVKQLHKAEPRRRPRRLLLGRQAAPSARPWS